MKKVKLWLYMEYLLFKNKVKPYITWTIFPAFLLSWFITNGWAYMLSIMATGWLKGVAITYLTLLWLPFTPEKLITIPLSIFIQKTIVNIVDIIKTGRVYKIKKYSTLTGV